MKIKMIQAVATLDQGTFKNGHEYDIDNADEFIRHGWGVPVTAPAEVVETPAPKKRGKREAD